MSKTIPLPAQGQILIDVAKYVDDVLGKTQQVDSDNYLNDIDCQSIPLDRAEAIVAVTNNQHTCYVQFPSDECPDLTQPVLWNWAAWKQSVERHRLHKEQSRKFLLEYNLQKANIDQLKRAILRQLNFTELQATIIATRWIRDNRQDMFTIFNIKLKTKEEL